MVALVLGVEIVPVGHKVHASEEFEPVLVLKVPGLHGVQLA